MDPNALPTPSDEITRAAAEPKLSQAIDAGQRANAIHDVEKAQGWTDSGNGLDTDTAAALEERRGD